MAEDHPLHQEGFQLVTRKGEDAPGLLWHPAGRPGRATHRCPLQCPYCSNPVELEHASNELTNDEWLRVIDELAEIGVLQIHFSGGEPARDLVQLVARAAEVGLYSNLITSGVMLDRARLAGLADAGLEPCADQPGPEPGQAATGSAGSAMPRRIEVARWTRELDLPLTVNAVMHRQNLHQLPQIIDMAVDPGASAP